MECICKKEQGLLDNPCDRTILKKAENEALVHLTSNFQNDHFFICNCCGCCCGVLHAINKLGIPAQTVVNSHYFAKIAADECTACGTCAEERCQIKAIEEHEDVYQIIQENCIGCGLCLTTCPAEAISLVRKAEEEITMPPLNEKNWFKIRGQRRGVDFSKFQ